MGRSGRMHRSERRTASTPVGIHIAMGTVVVIGAALLAAILPATAGWWREAPLAAAVLVIGMYTVDMVAVVAVAVLAYLLFIGFLVNQFGVLTWHGTADLYRLLTIVGSATSGLLIGVVLAWRRRPRPVIVPPEWGVVIPPRALTLTNKEEFPGG